LADLALRIGAARGGLAGALCRAARSARAVPGPRRVLDFLLRTGPHGDRFLPFSRGLNLRRLEAQPKGVDLGPLEPALERVLRTTGRASVPLDAPLAQGELARLRGWVARAAAADGALVLIGRRELRSNNSWGHHAASP